MADSVNAADRTHRPFQPHIVPELPAFREHHGRGPCHCDPHPVGSLPGSFADDGFASVHFFHTDSRVYHADHDVHIRVTGRSSLIFQIIWRFLFDEKVSYRWFDDNRVKPLENKIDAILNLIKEIADAPAPTKSVSYKDIAPLAKSEEEVMPLNKSEVSSKLWELKKSGAKVDTMDITQAELGSPATLQKIVAKYNIK